MSKVTPITIQEYFSKPEFGNMPLIDVRSPMEYGKGHISGAISIPIFNDEERGQIGKLYKEKGKEPAIFKGLEIIGPKLKDLTKQAFHISSEKRAVIHCWRGGMRSASFAAFLNALGHETYTLIGGYKAFRNWVLEQFLKPYPFKILGGFTGSGKTKILDFISKLGANVIDLEKLASHLGSVFGTLGTFIQPSQEQFENELALTLFKLDNQEAIWIEDESRTLGKIGIPSGIWDQMRIAKVYKLDFPVQRRIANIEMEYGQMQVDFILDCIQKISKRLGGMETKIAMEAVKEGQRKIAIELLLNYYDRTYSNGQSTRDPKSIMLLPFQDESIEDIAVDLIKIL